VSAKGIIVDRDGTLIDFHRDAELGAVVSAFHPDQIRWLPGVLEGLRALAGAGFALAIATNQPGAAKGQIPLEAIHRTNGALVAMLAAQGIAIAAVQTCTHHPDGGPGGDPTLVGPCRCRKPEPGMLIDLCAELGLEAAASWMIGDGKLRRCTEKLNRFLDFYRFFEVSCPLSGSRKVLTEAPGGSGARQLGRASSATPRSRLSYVEV